MVINEARQYPECQVLGELKGGVYIKVITQVKIQDIKDLETACESL